MFRWRNFETRPELLRFSNFELLVSFANKIELVCVLQCHITRSVLPAFIPLCCSIDFWNSWCVSVKSSPNGKKFLSIFFCILAINQRNQITKVFNYEMFGTNPSSDGINCYEIEGKPVFGFWAHLLAKNTSLIICMI